MMRSLNGCGQSVQYRLTRELVAESYRTLLISDEQAASDALINYGLKAR
jgi:hypothetical protein